MREGEIANKEASNKVVATDMRTRARVRPSGGQTSLDPNLQPLRPRAWWSSKGTPSPHPLENPFSLLHPNRVLPATSALYLGLLSSADQRVMVTAPMTFGDGSSKEETWGHAFPPGSMRRVYCEYQSQCTLVLRVQLRSCTVSVLAPHQTCTFRQQLRK